MPRRIESLFIAGPSGRLEASLEEPETQEPVAAAIACHPHPQHGGTMHNKVVYRLARGLRKAGCVALRFNFRGVNLSEGVYDHGLGEIDDAAAALQELRGRYPQLPIVVSGFSFGARVALRLAANDDTLSRVIAVGFPTKYPNREYVYDVRIPKFFIQSTHDEFAPRKEMEDFFKTLDPPKQISWVEAADHFFRDNLDGLEAEVVKVGKLR
jgi:uncharacterized protein